jgi:hypothetical protein
MAKTYRASFAAAFAVGLAAAVSACTSGGAGAGAAAPRGAPPTGPDFAAPGAPQPALPRMEVFHERARQRQDARAFLFLPGATMTRDVPYQVVDGMAIFEGDMVLGPASVAPVRYAVPPPTPGNVRGAVAMASREHLWKGSEMPYVIDRSAAGKRAWIEWAVSQMNTTSLRLRPRQPNDPDYVVFRDRGEDEGCWSYLGRIGGAQDIETGGCGRGSIIHEIMHAAGFYHEQSRGDRDDFVTIVWSEIGPSFRSQFEKRDSRGRDIGGYDYGSILHYSSRAFSTTGRPTIVPRTPNVAIGQREGLSAGDRSALDVLYGGSRRPPVAPPPVAPPPVAPPPVAPPPVAPPPVRPPPVAPPPVAPPPVGPPPVAKAGFTGSYTSTVGNVACTQSGVNVSCSIPGGSMVCTATQTHMDCGWTSTGGAGRAFFVRQPNGVLAGTWGDFFSSNSRGAWNLTPTGGVPPPAPPPPTPGFFWPFPSMATTGIPPWWPMLPSDASP